MTPAQVRYALDLLGGLAFGIFLVGLMFACSYYAQGYN